jgi:hypothetical protein
VPPPLRRVWPPHAQALAAPSGGWSSGSRRVSLWKNSLRHMAQDRQLPPVERAVWGALAGELGPVLSRACGWDDALWAVFKRLQDAMVGDALCEVVTQADLPYTLTQADAALEDALLVRGWLNDRPRADRAPLQQVCRSYVCIHTDFAAAELARAAGNAARACAGTRAAT